MKHDKIVLGTVQMGVPYGINNHTGKISRHDSFAILSEARKCGIFFVDTAASYGDAHDVIGSYHLETGFEFQTITKFPASDSTDNYLQKITEYLGQLHVRSLWGMMFHSFDSLKLNEHLLVKLTEVKKQGLVKLIGASVYSNEEAEYALGINEIDFIQIPYNLLDNLYQRKEVLLKAIARGKVVHTRSTFLQGLFFKPLENYPTALTPLKKYVQYLHGLLRENSFSMEEASLLYCIQQEKIDKVIVGIDNVDHLRKNIMALGRVLPDHLLDAINEIKVDEVELLYPRNWKRI